jgi:AdoMet-dependent heme synthase
MSGTTSYDRGPLMFYWEMTRACDLACRHCRAAAIAQRDPRELTTAEGRRLLETISAFDPKPHVVLTGGDPLRRPDVYSLVEYATTQGLVVSVTPSGTPSCTKEVLIGLRDSGVSSVAFSLDGSSERRHDHIRGVEGSFRYTVDAVAWALACGLPVQINTLVSAETAPDLAEIHRLVCDLGVPRWALFFLIQVGRGAVLNDVAPDDAEQILIWLHERSQAPKPVIKTTEAHHFRRIAAQRQAVDGGSGSQAASIRRSWNIRDGAGVMFVSHVGDVYPSGFLPIPVGNVRVDDPVQLYRDAPLFRQLRDADQFKGKCGRCEFRVICGGSRARAFAATRDPLEADPLCPYQPGTAMKPGPGRQLVGLGA